MANHLDLEEQEQLDQIKHFWAQYGNLITWVLIAVLGGMAAWNGWNYWQRTQAAKASALYEEIERAALARDADKVERAYLEMKDRFGGTTFAEQGALLAGKALYETGKVDGARAALVWAAGQAKDPAYQALARLRLAALDIQAKAFDQALKNLDGSMPKSFEALAADRRGDVYMAQGNAEEAKKQYLAAWRGLDTRADYRQLVEVKLASLGVDAATQGATAEGAN